LAVGLAVGLAGLAGLVAVWAGVVSVEVDWEVWEAGSVWVVWGEVA
jgi:hypothetical protein